MRFVNYIFYMFRLQFVISVLSLCTFGIAVIGLVIVSEH